MWGFGWLLRGKLAGMGRPGTPFFRDAGAGGAPDARLQEDLRLLKREGVGAVVSLTEDALHEATVRAAGFDYLHLPVLDMAPPVQADIDRFVRFAEASIAAGRPVAVHCAAGRGRTGTMLACYLVKGGRCAEQAIHRVRQVRPGSVETPEQAAAVFAYARRLAGERP